MLDYITAQIDTNLKTDNRLVNAEYYGIGEVIEVNGERYPAVNTGTDFKRLDLGRDLVFYTVGSIRPLDSENYGLNWWNSLEVDLSLYYLVNNRRAKNHDYAQLIMLNMPGKIQPDTVNNKTKGATVEMIRAVVDKSEVINELMDRDLAGKYGTLGAVKIELTITAKGCNIDLC